MRIPPLRAIAKARGEAGTIAVEAAIILPLLILLMTGLFDLGFLAYEGIQVQAAAEAGAQYAARNAWNAAAIADIVTSATGASGITASPVPSQFCGCPAGGTLVRVACTARCADGTLPSVYGEVHAQLEHWTILSYPAVPRPFTVSGKAITRVQ